MLDENRINELALKAISTELLDIWEFSQEDTVKTAYVICGILELRDSLLTAIKIQKELIKK